MKQIGKIYSAVDADELEIGDIVELTNYPKSRGVECELQRKGGNESYPFTCENDMRVFLFAKLICPKKHAEVYKAWKNGTKIAHKIPALRQWYPTDNPSWAEDEEFRAIEPAHGMEENLTAWSFKENKWIEIPEDNTERMTNRELAMWLAKGNGEVKSPYYLPERTRCHFDYHGYAEKEIVASDILIRTWDDEEWHEPIKVKE